MTKTEWDNEKHATKTPDQLAAYRARLAHWNARQAETFVGTGWMTGDNWELAGGVEFHRTFPTVADAEMFAATLPKSLKARATSMSGHLPNGARSGFVFFRAVLKQDGVNGGVNETGLKRLRAAVKAISFEWNPDTCANSMTEEFFKALIK